MSAGEIGSTGTIESVVGALEEMAERGMRLQFTQSFSMLHGDVKTQVMALMAYNCARRSRGQVPGGSGLEGAAATIEPSVYSANQALVELQETFGRMLNEFAERHSVHVRSLSVSVGSNVTQGRKRYSGNHRVEVEVVL